MSESQQTTTSPAAPTGRFEPPELLVNEAIVAQRLKLEICAENFSSLLAANFLVALDGHDRKLTREFYEDVLVMTFNFQNRMTRIAELGTVLELIADGGDILEKLTEEMAKHLEQANTHKRNLLRVLDLYAEMRTAKDPVS